MLSLYILIYCLNLNNSDLVHTNDSLLLFGRDITPEYSWLYNCKAKYLLASVDLEQQKLRIIELLQSSMEITFAT